MTGLNKRIDALERRDRPPGRVYVEWADGQHVSVDGVRYAAGDAPERAEGDFYVVVTGGYYGGIEQAN